MVVDDHMSNSTDVTPNPTPQMREASLKPSLSPPLIPSAVQPHHSPALGCGDQVIPIERESGELNEGALRQHMKPAAGNI